MYEASYAWTGTTVRVFEGIEELVYNGSGDLASTYNVTASVSKLSGSNDLKIGNKNKTGIFCTFGDVSDMSQFVDIAKIIFTITGKNSNGVIFPPINIEQTITKSKAGKNGLNSSTVYLYKRFAGLREDIPMPTDNCTYNFIDSKLTGQNNEWETNIPLGKDQLYVIGATASSDTNIDEIKPNEWSGAVELGSDGFNSATIYLYQRKATRPNKPTGDCEYTFKTGKLTGQNNEWEQNILTGDLDLWVTTATAVSTKDTDTIESEEWAIPEVMSSHGKVGENGLNVATLYLYKRSKEYPLASEIPNQLSTYNFANEDRKSVV